MNAASDRLDPVPCRLVDAVAALSAKGKRPLIGLTGRRQVGKSTIARMLEGAGFVRVHAFDGGKAAAIGYFRHLGADEETASRMVHGDLRDSPSDLLPNKATPRFFMERFGSFMGKTLGPEWTLGAELDRVEKESPGKPIIVESVVYEVPVLRRRGGKIVRVVRPGHCGPTGEETDGFQETILEDRLFINCVGLENLEASVARMIASL